METEVSDAVPQWLLRGCEDEDKARELFSRNVAQYSPQPIDTSRVRLYGLVVHIVDLLAQNAHETWAAGRIQQDWRWGPTRDSEQKLHPSIVPYEWLSDDEKQYDRNVVNDMLKVIMAVGFILEPCGEQELTAEFGKAPADPNDTYVPKPIPTDKVRVPAELWSLVELLAEHLHESWAKARMEQGWTYGRQRDDANMEHSSLLPYIYLREEDKQYDRGWATENLKVILRCGFRLIHKTNRTSAPRNLPTNSGTELADSRTAKEEMTEFPAWFIPEDDIASTGSTLDTFDIGTVFLATWKSQTVAIKQIAGRIDSILPAMTAFHRLSHPHVIKLFGGIHTRSPPLIVFEFAALGCMREYLQQHPDANKWRLLYEAALGLQFLHENQIVHDDLRLDKILISSEGRAKLSITRLCRGEIPRVRFRWYAPERIYGEPTIQSDVFSLGLCIYEVATGRIPYVEVPTYREMSVMIQDGSLPSRVDGLDEEVWRLIEQLTRRSPESRMDIQNAVDALKKLSARKVLHGDMPKMTVVGGQAISSVSEAVELLRHPSYHDPYCMALKWIRRHMMLIETYSDLVDLGGIPLLRQAAENLNSPFAHRLYAFDALYHINKTVLFEAMTAVIAQLKPLLRHPDEIEVSSLLNRMMDEALGDDRLEAIEVLSIYWAQDMISGDMNFIIQNLIRLLEVDDEELNAVGAMAISGLTTSKSTTNSILRRTVRPLLGLLKSNEERRQQCASVALGNLAANSSDNANAIANDGGVHPLLDLLKTGSKRSKECAAYALSHLAADVGEVADEIAASDGVRLLVQLLSMGTNGAKQWAASALGNLAANSHDITVIVEKAGCVGPLVDLIKTGPSGCKECAAYALGRFAEISVAITVSIATAGAVDPLVDLLKTGSHEAKQMAAFALSKIAAHSLVAKRSIIEVGAVEPLVSLVKKGWVGDRRWGAYALGHLAANSPEAKVSITRAGGIGPLVNLVTMGSAEGKLWAAYALANLAANSPRTADTIREAGGINPLLDLLKFGPLAAKERAISALGHLIACSPKSKTLVAKSGAVGSMVDVLKSGSTVAKERAASVLYQLAMIYPGVKIRATKAGAIGILTKLARCETNEDKKSKLRRGARISPITNSSIEKCGVFVSLLEALKAAPLTSVAELETSSNERAARLSESEGTLPSIKNSKPINQDFYSSRLPGRWKMRLLTESKTLELTILSDSPPHRCFHSPIQISLLFRGLEVGRLKRRTELAKAAMQLVFKLGLADGVTFVSTDPGGLTPAETHDLLLTALKLAYEDADVEERIEELSGLQLAIDTKKMGLKWISKNEAGPFMVFMEDGRVWPEMEILTTNGLEAGEVYVIDWELLDGLGQWVAKGILQPKPARLPVFLERILGELYLRITVRHLQPSSSRIQPLTGVPETISIATIALADKIPMPVVFDSIVWDEELNVGLYTVRCRLRSSCGMDDGARFQVYETVSRFALMAAKYGDVSVLMRIPVSCVINIRDSKKRSLLHVAAKHRNPSILKKLLELGIGEHDRDLFGRTAAHYACANGDIVCLDLLMKSGSDPTTVDERGIGLLDIVKATGHLHLLCVLAPYLLGLARNSIPPSHESHARVQRGGMARRIGGAAISLMGKVTGRGFASRVTPANIPQQGANDRQENVATTTLTGREESDQEDRFVCFHKVCVLGTNADKRRKFINSIVQTSEPFVERAGKYRLSEWAITEFIPNEGLARIHRIFFWDIPSEPDLEVVNTLFFSDPTLFMICVDLRDFVCEPERDSQTSPNDTVFE